ncbi:hypothetical protein UFOVP807_9 [uncultured Caudovirales phage]|uniref:Portal protein n=1 Tax=uncultured Caudovirales phage TaxID=2100421 RepID=A0A6J5M1A7_9CAUD|nr:hypothetical protein UFOVP339_32 [uncultured Caudovirales phage]CAB4163339.1 hypothetical protein UFOVP807_9 [uncultured Caudovirales phage]
MEANEPQENYDVDSGVEGEQMPKGIKRDPDPNAKDSTKALVKEWQGKIMRAKKHWERPLQAMKEDMDFYMGKQWPGHRGPNDDRYVANLVQRHVQTRVAALYAKNPKAVAKRRSTLDFTIWEGDASQLESANTANQQSFMATGMPDPHAMALMADVEQGFEKRRQLDKIGKTMEIIFHHIIETQNIKGQMKQLVRRTCVTGVGFVKIGYQRVMSMRPEDVEKLTDITEQIKTLDRLEQDLKDQKFDENSAKRAQLELLKKELMEKEDMIIDEGIVFDFPQSQTIIVDTRCRQLKGFIGAEWVAQEFILTSDEVKEIYGVDLGTSFTRQENKYVNSDDKSECDVARIWEIYSKRDGLKYVIADGYPDFLVEPGCPEIKLKRFWPFFLLSFNEVESDRDIYPPSDVRLMKPIQLEYNLARQRLREHRNANRPLYVTPVGMLSEGDVKKLMDRQPNEVIQLMSLQPGQAVNQLLQPVQPIPVDPSLYDTSMFMEDLFRVVGSQEANLGGGTGNTATEVSVAESSRMSSMGSHVDDLDEFLTELARAAGAVMLKLMDPSSAMKIAGPGAAWPTLSSQEIADELLLEIEAGSSGRPNKAADIAAFERLAPLLIQIPGIDPTWLAKEAIKRMDDGLDMSEAVRAALPSIVQMNAQKQMAEVEASQDPNLQGPAGGQPAAPAMAPGAPGGGNANAQVPNIPQPKMYGIPQNGV